MSFLLPVASLWLLGEGSQIDLCREFSEVCTGCPPDGMLSDRKKPRTVIGTERGFRAASKGGVNYLLASGGAHVSEGVTGVSVEVGAGVTGGDFGSLQPTSGSINVQKSIAVQIRVIAQFLLRESDEC